MSDDKKQPDDILTDTSLAFFGAITASVSHELNNVIAIMEQTTGLLEDRLAVSEGEVVIPAEKLARIVTSLQNQSTRGLDIIKRLNRFAHSADYPRQKFDINATLQNLAALTNRLAVLKGATLDSRFSNTPFEIESNPFYLQQAVFAVLRLLLARAQKGDELTIAAEETDGRVEIKIEGPAAEDAEPESVELVRVMEVLRGTAEVKAADGRITVRLILTL